MYFQQRNTEGNYIEQKSHDFNDNVIKVEPTLYHPIKEDKKPDIVEKPKEKASKNLEIIKNQKNIRVITDKTKNDNSQSKAESINKKPKNKTNSVYQNLEKNIGTNLLDEVTIVTAYFNLGNFEKGGPGNIYTPERYYKWMTIFSKIYNPLVAYVENKKENEKFSSIRSSVPQNPTIMRGIERNKTWAFGLRSKTKAIFDQPGYPKHKPNTVNPDYSVVMHYKYEAMWEVALENPFKTKYFAWVDIGLYRDIANKDTKPFKIYLPSAMNLSQVAYAKVYDMLKKTSKEIFYGNLVWVCGCFFIAERESMLKWTKDYMDYTEKFLNEGLANLDQQVIYAMQANEHPSVRIQAYEYPGTGNAWFHLGHTCKAEGMKRM